VTGSAPGTFTNITGNVTSTNGGTGNTATAGLQVGDYSISLSPNTETIPPGHMASFTLTISSSTGFQGKIDLSGSGGPPGSTLTNYSILGHVAFQQRDRKGDDKSGGSQRRVEVDNPDQGDRHIRNVARDRAHRDCDLEGGA
jgi:hypothetical protein